MGDNTPAFLPKKMDDLPGFEAARGNRQEGKMAFHISSPAFKNGEYIPQKNTCSGADLSPAMTWEDVPAGTQSFVMIVEDPDAPAGTWVHWVIYDIPSTRNGLEEGVAKIERVAGLGVQGRNDFRRIGYGGPCPPPGKPHRYIFNLYALDNALQINAGATKAEVERAMHGHIIGRALLMGMFAR